MARTYRFRVLTPSSTALDEDVTSVVVPGEDGYLGVLADHAPLITTLRPGTLTVRTPGGGERRWRVGAGVLRVGREGVVLLAESFEAIDAAGGGA